MYSHFILFQMHESYCG